MNKSIVISERDNIAAVLENGRAAEFYIHKGDILLNDVYLAKVENILPSIDAAFVNVGSDKMGFLHASDVIGRGALQDKLKPGQKIIVQVVKEPTGHKGPRVTMSLSLPGRFLVLMPEENGISISRKISSAKERARLKSIVSLIKPAGLGVIIRTEAEHQTDAEIQEDLEILLEKWTTIVNSADTIEPPNLLYRDQDLLYRVIREACTEDIEEIIFDTPFAMHRATQILQSWNMGKNIKLKTYKGSEPILVATGVDKEIKAALQIKVNLPSGGYLFIETTEALSVIDVNSGKFTSSATQAETIKFTNLEAIDEIARQLRLRNIGGMIIIDFIDMLSRADKIAILEEMELAIESDKAKPQVGQLSDLGLVEMTRHRQGQSLAEVFGKKCSHCQGTGFVVEEMNFSSAVAEGEYRSKVAKLKLPMSGNHGKHKPQYPDKSNNKVFNHQNPAENNKKNNRRNAKAEIVEQEAENIQENPQTTETPAQKKQKPQRNSRKRTNRNTKKEAIQMADELLENKQEEAVIEQPKVEEPKQETPAPELEITETQPQEAQTPAEENNSETPVKKTGKGKPRRATRTRRKSSEKSEKAKKTENEEKTEQKVEE